jgi:hypothetical protein
MVSIAIHYDIDGVDETKRAVKFEDGFALVFAARIIDAGHRAIE